DPPASQIYTPASQTDLKVCPTLNLDSEEGRYKFVIEQGDFIHRPSRINLDVKGSAGSVEEVKVGGLAVLVARGEVVFDHE
ncbi:MAG TPA: hypothetical protein VFZ71_07385, partial [Pyrinomonadaceae bacterium]